MVRLLDSHKINYFRIFIAQFDPSSNKNWIFFDHYDNASDLELYISSVYFCVTTVMTVGYGDITA